MIRSKLDALKERRLTACTNLEKALSTKRGTSEARTEAVLKRQKALDTGLCSCCGKDEILGNGLCRSCDAAMKRMLTFKSSLSTKWPTEKRTRRFLEDYKSMPDPPYSLRGSAPREIIMLYIEELLDVVMALDYETKRTELRRHSTD